METSCIEFEISSHFLSSVELVNSQLCSDCATSAPWRWITIGLYDAIYCALVLKLSRTDMFGVYPESLEKKAGEFYRKGLSSNTPEWDELSKLQAESKLADFSTLLKRAKLESGARVHKNVSSSSGLARSITLLKKRRDMFAHPEDVSLVSTSTEFKEVATDCLIVLREILGMKAFRNYDLPEHRVERLLGDIEKGLQRK